MRPHSAIRLSQSAAYLGHVLAGGRLHVPCSVTTLSDPATLRMLLGDDDDDDDDGVGYADGGDGGGGSATGSATGSYAYYDADDDGSDGDGEVDYLVEDDGGGRGGRGGTAWVPDSDLPRLALPSPGEDDAGVGVDSDHAAQLVAVMRDMVALGVRAGGVVQR